MAILLNEAAKELNEKTKRIESSFREMMENNTAKEKINIDDLEIPEDPAEKNYCDGYQ